MPRRSVVERSRIAFFTKSFLQNAVVGAANSASSWRSAKAGGPPRPYDSVGQGTKRHAPVPVRPYRSNVVACPVRTGRETTTAKCALPRPAQQRTTASMSILRLIPTKSSCAVRCCMLETTGEQKCWTVQIAVTAAVWHYYSTCPASTHGWLRQTPQSSRLRRQLQRTQAGVSRTRRPPLAAQGGTGGGHRNGAPAAS